MGEKQYNQQKNTALGLQDPRNTESYALVEIARRMKQAQDEQYEREELIAVYQLNWKLWTIFQSELSNPDNQLADDIKVNMIQLANFIDQHTIEQLRKPTHQGLDVLININRQVGAGLMGNSGNDASDAEITAVAAMQTPTPANESQPPAASQTGVRTPQTSAPTAKKPLFRSKKVSD